MNLNLRAYRFEYSIGRPITAPWFAPVIFSVGLIYVIVITFVNVIAVGYDTINYNSIVYNETHSLWYDKLVPFRGPSYNHRSCEPALLKLNDYVTTNSYFDFFLYQLINFIDLNPVATIDGVNYTNNPFSDCSISALQMTEYSQPVSPDLKATGIIGCNTTSGKFLYFETSNEEGVVAVGLQSGTSFSAIENHKGPLDILDAVTLWTLMVRKLWYSFSTDATATNLLSTRTSFLRYSITGPNVASPLSYLRFSYSDTLAGGTPANGTWIMSVNYLNQSTVVENFMRIVFLPTGQIDTTLTSPSDLSAANAVLAPTIQLVEQFANASNIPNFNFWELMNWMFVSQYWALLADFGQLSPTTFTYNSSTGTVINYNPVSYPSTYNIFVNDTLFDIYYSYLLNTVLPLFAAKLPDFSPLNETNQISASNVSLKLLYACTDLQLKSSQNLVVSVLVADWAFISTVFTIALVLGSWYEQLRSHDGKFCEGCKKREDEMVAVWAASRANSAQVNGLEPNGKELPQVHEREAGLDMPG